MEITEKTEEAILDRTEEIKRKLIPQELPKVKELPVSPKEVTNEEKEIIALIEDLGSLEWSKVQEATEKLANLGKVAIPKLSEALKEASVGLKGQIVFLLGRIGDKAATPTLIETLKDESPYIRRNAAEALGKIKDEQAIFELTKALFDEDGSVRERSAWVLGELEDNRSIEDLINRMIDEKEERVKSAVVDAFAKIKDQRATLVLLKELSSKSNYLYKNEVVFALGEIGDPRALPGLIEHLDYLKQLQPTEPMIIFLWEEAIKITEEAIQKIREKQGDRL